MKCPECDEEVVIEKIPYRYKDQIYLGEFEAERCLKCGTEYFTEEAYNKIEKVAKTMMIWGVNRLPDFQVETTVKVTKNIPTIDLMTLYGNITFTREAITVGVW